MRVWTISYNEHEINADLICDGPEVKPGEVVTVVEQTELAKYERLLKACRKLSGCVGYPSSMSGTDEFRAALAAFPEEP